MNPLTTAAFALALLYTLGAIVYAWHDRHRLQRPVFSRFMIGALAFYGLSESALLLFDRGESLAAHGLWANLLQGVCWTTYVLFVLRMAKPRSPVPDRYAYTPSRQDLRLIWLALSLPGAALLAVFAVLIAHAFTAHS